MKKKILAALLILFSSISLTGCSVSSHSLNRLFNSHFVLNRGPIITKKYREKKFTNLNIDDNTGDIKFKVANHYQIIYKGGKKLAPSLSMKGDTLTIQNKNAVSIGFNGGGNQTLIVEMPKAYLNSAKIYTANGDITGSTIKMKSGSITSDNGDIDLDNLYLQEKVKVDSDNGDINIGNCNAKGYHLSSGNGDVDFNGDDEDDSFKQNTSSKPLLSAYSDNGDVSVN